MALNVHDFAVFGKAWLVTIPLGLVAAVVAVATLAIVVFLLAFGRR
jgi:hypothetical protein